jgi:hypothetical protein
MLPVLERSLEEKCEPLVIGVGLPLQENQCLHGYTRDHAFKTHPDVYVAVSADAHQPVLLILECHIALGVLPRRQGAPAQRAQMAPATFVFQNVPNITHPMHKANNYKH